jgi:hypothetical protein
MASILGRASLESSTAPVDPGEGQGMIFFTGDDPIDSIKCSYQLSAISFRLFRSTLLGLSVTFTLSMDGFSLIADRVFLPPELSEDVPADE